MFYYHKEASCVAIVPVIGIVGIKDVLPTRKNEFLNKFVDLLNHSGMSFARYSVMTPVLNSVAKSLRCNVSDLFNDSLLLKKISGREKRAFGTNFGVTGAKCTCDVLQQLYTKKRGTIPNYIRRLTTESEHPILFTDVRKGLEAETIRLQGGVIIHVENVPEGKRVYSGRISVRNDSHDLHFDYEKDKMKEFVMDVLMPRLRRRAKDIEGFLKMTSR